MILNGKMEEQIMKRLFNVMAALVAVSAFAASCAKPELESTENGSTTPDIYDGPVKTLVFEAVIGETPTKTTLGDPVTGADGTVTVPILWENGDKVDVHWKNGEESASATGEIVVDEQTGKANFSVKIPESLPDETVFYAVYPSGITASLSPESGEFQIIIPTYTGTFKEANIMVARCSNAKQAPAFAFKHACGIIRLETGAHAFKDGKRVDRISLYNGTRTRFKGYVSFDFPSDNQISVNTKTGASDKYVNAEKVEPYSECYFPVFPDYEFEKGFIVSFYNEQLAAYSEKTFTVARGQILNLGNVEARINDHRDFYFKPTASGTGDATSWENAGDIAKLRELLTEVEDGDAAYAQRIKLDNTNYHFMQGEYQLAEGGDGSQRFDLKYTIASRGFSTPLNFYGGYSSADPTVRDPQRYETVFTGNKQYAILAVRDRVILNLDGIIFKDAVADAAHAKDQLYGAALYLGLSVEGNNAPQVNLRNCQFINNVQTTGQLTSNNHDGGSAINVRDGKIYVEDCLFKANVGSKRGPIRISNSASSGTCVFFNNCLFTENYSASSYGSVVWAADKDCKFGLNNCTFYNNYPPEGKSSTSTGIINLVSPFVLTNNTFVESTVGASNNHGIIRIAMDAKYAGSAGLCANNILIEKNDRYAIRYIASESYAFTLTSGGYNYISKASISGNGLTYNKSDKDVVDGVSTADFGDWAYDSVNGYCTWNGSYASSDKTMSYMPSAELVTATRNNSLIGDDFYNWLVEIGAIVDGKFTDCRGYIRPTDAMCPGAYDPNAQPTL